MYGQTDGLMNSVDSWIVLPQPVSPEGLQSLELKGTKLEIWAIWPRILQIASRIQESAVQRALNTLNS